MTAQEAVEQLQQILVEAPDQFIPYFYTAIQTPAYTFAMDVSTVGTQWVEAHTANLASTPTEAKVVANAILTNAAAMLQIKNISAKVWFVMCEALFPFFDLPPGWRAIAERGGLLPGHIATFVTNRVKAIDSFEKAQQEILFIRELLRVPDDARLRYQPLMDRRQLRAIARTLQRFAPEEMAAVHDPRSMWRHGL